MSKFKNFFLILLAFISGSFISIFTTLALAHGGDTNLVHSCVKNTLLAHSPNIRIIDSNENCTNNETALDWPKTAGSNTPKFPFFCTGCSFDDVYVGSTFAGKDLTNAKIGASSFNATDFTNTNLTNANIRDTSFFGAKLVNTNLTGANLISAEFQSGVDFHNANLTNVNFTDAELIGVVNINTAIRTGITWSNTTCPDGTNSDNNGNTCEGHL
jgi:uncharacterized protein YjbI with pentapeptide repeats